MSSTRGAPWIESAAARNVHATKEFSIHLLVVHGNRSATTKACITRANNNTQAGWSKVCAAQKMCPHHSTYVASADPAFIMMYIDVRVLAWYL